MTGRKSASRYRRLVSAGMAVTLLASAGCSDDGDGEAAGDGGGYEATIVRTEDGVPHITGDTMADVVFGQGYASGEDRTCDLADQIVKIRGERALHLGPGDDDANITSDVTWGTIGLFDRAVEDWDDEPDQVVEVLTAYTDGWNAHLDEVGAGSVDGWCAGEEWVRPLEPVEVYAYGRSVALLASSGNPDLGGMLASAQPPGTDEAADADGESDGDAEGDEAALAPRPEQLGSNGWALGSERTVDGTGMLVGNPHFPWEGENRFWEVHLTIPGELNAYGVQLSGLPGIGIGFNENVAWTHTVSAGNRFTAYMLDLVEGDPTSYHYGDEVREMESYDVTVEVLGDDGDVVEETHTLWRTHYGPVLDFPGLGWSEEQTLSFKDANLDNRALFEQYLGMVQAGDMDELIEVHAEHGGIPLFNTIATSSEGRAWYADTSATPNLSDEAITTYEQALEDDPIVSIAADNQAVLLDGSDPENEWVEVDGARSPGLVPFDDMPMVERDDYVFNANDSFWLSHASELLEGDYSPLHGWQDAPVSPRTRENATILDDTSDDGPAGEDGLFDLESLSETALQNTGYTSRALLDEVVERCDGVESVDVPSHEVDGEEALPAATVDVAEACEVLAAWDGVYDLDRAGPPVWRELVHQVDSGDLRDAGELWAEPFDPARPVETPSGLVEAPDDGPDPVVERLGRAVQLLDEAGLPVDVTLGEAQFAMRSGEVVPIHGGDNHDGTTNIVSWGTLHSVLDPALDEGRDELVPGSPLATVDDQTGYPVNNGTSFLLAVDFADDGPQARAFLTYGNTEDRDDPLYVEGTQRFSDKEWRTVLFDPDDVADAPSETLTVTG